jgi:hypothetical protein
MPSFSLRLLVLALATTFAVGCAPTLKVHVLKEMKLECERRLKNQQALSR